MKSYDGNIILTMAGGVVRDIGLPHNQNSFNKSVLLMRCSDWQYYEEPKEQWCEPLYLWENKYLKNVRTELLNEVKSQLEICKHKYLVHRNKLRLQEISKIHKKYLDELGLSSKLTAPSSNIRRKTHCLKCKNHLDSVTEFICGACNGMVCSKCGACLCGFTPL